MTEITLEAGLRIIHHNYADDELKILGYNYGKLIYILDAVEDFDSDEYKGEFNALRYAYGIDEKEISEKHISKVKKITDAVIGEIEAAGNMLPMDEQYKDSFKKRIHSNVEKKLNSALEKKPFRKKITAAYQEVKQLRFAPYDPNTLGFNCICPCGPGYIQASDKEAGDFIGNVIGVICCLIICCSILSKNP